MVDSVTGTGSADPTKTTETGSSDKPSKPPVDEYTSSTKVHNMGELSKVLNETPEGRQLLAVMEQSYGTKICNKMKSQQDERKKRAKEQYGY